RLPQHHMGGSATMNDPQGHNKHGPGVSRRQFLLGSGAAAATALAPTPLPSFAEEADTQQVVGIGPGPAKIALQVNGKTVTHDAIEPRVTLLDALRDYLDVTA